MPAGLRVSATGEWRYVGGGGGGPSISRVFPVSASAAAVPMPFRSQPVRSLASRGAGGGGSRIHTILKNINKCILPLPPHLTDLHTFGPPIRIYNTPSSSCLIRVHKMVDPLWRVYTVQEKSQQFIFCQTRMPQKSKILTFRNHLEPVLELQIKFYNWDILVSWDTFWDCRQLNVGSLLIIFAHT